MGKKCVICDEEARFCVKGTTTTYCKDCAVEQFGDITYLVSVEEEAKRLKEVLDKQLDTMSDVDLSGNRSEDDK